MRLTVFTDYALRVLMVLGRQQGQLVTISEVARAFEISQPHLMKVTHLLGKTPWVETRRGRGGGMRLIVEPRALRIGDAVQFLEGNFGLAECLQPDGRCCLSRGCGLISVLLGASDAFVASLNRYTLADVLATSPALQQLSFVPMSQIRAAAEAP